MKHLVTILSFFIIGCVPSKIISKQSHSLDYDSTKPLTKGVKLYEGYIYLNYEYNGFYPYPIEKPRYRLGSMIGLGYEYSWGEDVPRKIDTFISKTRKKTQFWKIRFLGKLVTEEGSGEYVLIEKVHYLEPIYLTTEDPPPYPRLKPGL